MATKFSPCKGSYVLNQSPSNVMFGMNGFHVSASGAIQGHHGPLVPKINGQENILRAICKTAASIDIVKQKMKWIVKILSCHF